MYLHSEKVVGFASGRGGAFLVRKQSLGRYLASYPLRPVVRNVQSRTQRGVRIVGGGASKLLKLLARLYFTQPGAKPSFWDFFFFLRKEKKIDKSKGLHIFFLMKKKTGRVKFSASLDL